MKSDRHVPAPRRSLFSWFTLQCFLSALALLTTHGAPGEKKWDLQIGATTSPALAPNGNIIVAAGGGLMSISQSGATNWNSPVGGESPTICITADGVIYVASDKLCAFNSDGSRRWAFDHSKSGFSTPVVAADGTVYSVAMDGRLYAVNPDGSVLWKVTAPRSSGQLALAKDGGLVGGFSSKSAPTANRHSDRRLAIDHVGKSFARWHDGWDAAWNICWRRIGGRILADARARSAA